ncbi:MAG: hypothetical protein ACO33Y_05655 [Burkholderiaceae bacterium]
MRNKAAVGVGVVGIAVAIGAFLLGLVYGAESATVSVVRDTPNVHCYEDTSPDQFTELHIETKVLACQVVGMTKEAAVDFLESEGRTVRIASEDGEYFALTEDYRDDRVNLDLLVGLVVGANAW